MRCRTRFAFGGLERACWRLRAVLQPVAQRSGVLLFANPATPRATVRAAAGTAPNRRSRAVELAHGGGQIRRPEIRPHHASKHQLGIGALPQQEVAEPPLAAGADQQIDGRPERFPERVAATALSARGRRPGWRRAPSNPPRPAATAALRRPSPPRRARSHSRSAAPSRSRRPITFHPHALFRRIRPVSRVEVHRHHAHQRVDLVRRAAASCPTRTRTASGFRPRRPAPPPRRGARLSTPALCPGDARKPARRAPIGRCRP